MYNFCLNIKRIYSYYKKKLEDIVVFEEENYDYFKFYYLKVVIFNFVRMYLYLRKF